MQTTTSTANAPRTTLGSSLHLDPVAQGAGPAEPAPAAVRPDRYALEQVDSDELVARLEKLVARHSALVAELVAHVAAVDARRLYLQRACSSMFAYATEVLHLSESAAYRLICAGRTARRFPVIFELLAVGKLHGAAVCLLAPHLTAQNAAELLAAAVHCSKRDLQRLLAARFPAADVPAKVRALPRSKQAAPPAAQHVPPAAPLPATPTVAPPVPPAGGGQPAESAPQPCAASRPAQLPLTTALQQGANQSPRAAGAAPAAPPAPPAPPAAAPPAPRADRRPGGAVSPLSATRYKVTFTASASLHDKLREAQDLLGRRVAPDDLETVIDLALEALVRDLRRKRFAQTDRPREPAPPARPPLPPGPSGQPAEPTPAAAGDQASRHIPSAVKRAVAARDGCQCTFVDPATGRRCSARSALEYHHRQPYGRGGASNLANIALSCKSHNLHAALSDYGASWMARYIPVADPRAAPARPGPSPTSVPPAARTGRSCGPGSAPGAVQTASTNAPQAGQPGP